MTTSRLWFVLSVSALGYLAFVLLGQTGDRRLFLPGETTSGHYQIELECAACHGEPFATAEQIKSAEQLDSAERLQASCERCHAHELEVARDAHPKSKFTDPRNAERVARLDARRCVTCHREHWPEGTKEMGLTLPLDYCYLCHSDIGRERPSHAGLSHFSCADSGCHNFHDNRALYEDFLTSHASEPALLPTPRVAPPRPPAPPKPLTLAERDGPHGVTLPESELAEWAASGHARAGVNCSGCHQTAGGWQDSVSLDICAECHAGEREGWVRGRHGMRVGLGLAPMTPGEARAPMHPAVASEPLGCASCHGAHGFNRRHAAVEACQACHSDAHSLAYADSPHHDTWLAEQAGTAPAHSGVSCATCHLPRLEDDRGHTFVQHNQNDNLRPRDKMIRNVCGACHGLAFTIDALADAALVDNNFNGQPEKHIPSIDWAVTRSRTARPGDPATQGD